MPRKVRQPWWAFGAKTPLRLNPPPNGGKRAYAFRYALRRSAAAIMPGRLYRLLNGLTPLNWVETLALRQENNMKWKVAATGLLLTLMTIDQAFAGWFTIVPNPTPPAESPVPEIDGPAGIAAIALLASVVAMAFTRSRNK
jgi:hypothetical protein